MSGLLRRGYTTTTVSAKEMRRMKFEQRHGRASAAQMVEQTAAIARRKRASSRPPMRSHALRPRRMGVPKELVGGALVEENGGHARLGAGVEHRLIKDEVVSCARHAKSKSAE